MHYCLSKDELSEFLDVKAQRKETLDDTYTHLRVVIKGAENWEDEVSCLNYFLSHLLEAKRKADESSINRFIEVLYSLENRIFIVIQEFDVDFVRFMLSHTRDRKLTLDEEMVGLQNRLREYDYGRIVRG